jgi:hypothetical protein
MPREPTGAGCGAYWPAGSRNSALTGWGGAAVKNHSGRRVTRSRALPAVPLGPRTHPSSCVLPSARPTIDEPSHLRRTAVSAGHLSTGRDFRFTLDGFHDLWTPLGGPLQRSLTVLVCYRLPRFHI